MYEEIETLDKRIKRLETEHKEARDKYTESFLAEKEKSKLVEDIQVLEDLEEEDLGGRLPKIHKVNLAQELEFAQNPSTNFLY